MQYIFENENREMGTMLTAKRSTGRWSVVAAALLIAILVLNSIEFPGSEVRLAGPPSVEHGIEGSVIYAARDGSDASGTVAQESTKDHEQMVHAMGWTGYSPGMPCAMSMRESHGFFCETDEDWDLRKRLYEWQQPRQASGELVPIEYDKFWQYYWQVFHEPQFSCRFEQRIGRMGDGGKWVCDPMRMKQLISNTSCLIYSIGSKNDFSFEKGVKIEFPECEIHTFDHTIETPTNPDYVTFHKWGVGPRDIPEKSLYTIATIREMLGHEHGSGKVVEIFKMDVEGHESPVLLQALEEGRGLKDVRQLLVELHEPKIEENGSRPYPRKRWHDAARYNNLLFEKLDEHGWLIFHKEFNAINLGKAVEYGFIHIDWSTKRDAATGSS